MWKSHSQVPLCVSIGEDIERLVLWVSVIVKQNPLSHISFSLVHCYFPKPYQESLSIYFPTNSVHRMDTLTSTTKTCEPDTVIELVALVLTVPGAIAALATLWIMLNRKKRKQGMLIDEATFTAANAMSRTTSPISHSVIACGDLIMMFYRFVRLVLHAHDYRSLPTTYAIPINDSTKHVYNTLLHTFLPSAGVYLKWR